MVGTPAAIVELDPEVRRAIEPEPPALGPKLQLGAEPVVEELRFERVVGPSVELEREVRQLGVRVRAELLLELDPAPAIGTLAPAHPQLARVHDRPRARVGLDDAGQRVGLRRKRREQGQRQQDRDGHTSCVDPRRPQLQIFFRPLANLGDDGRAPDMLSLASILLFGSLGPLERPGLHFIDVGQGSALLLRADGGELVLVDSGPASGAEAILHALAEHEAGELALWVHTHHDADHIGGFAPVLAGLDGRLHSDDDVVFGQLWDRGLTGTLPDSEALALYFTLAGERREVPQPGERFELAGLRIEVLALDPPPASAPENDRGLALCVDVGGVRALLPGDLSAARLELAAAACPGVDVLWLSHHGAADASSSAALALADPALIVVSAGHDNDHCHPSTLALALTHDRSTWILDAAGLDPRGACPALANALGPQQRLVGGDLWIDAALQPWLGGPTGWKGTNAP